MKKELIIGLLLAAVLLLNACGAQSGTVAVQRADQLNIRVKIKPAVLI